jgi:hypothetical protein
VNSFATHQPVDRRSIAARINLLERGSASFGTITTALDPRVVQLAAKLWF